MGKQTTNWADLAMRAGLLIFILGYIGMGVFSFGHAGANRKCTDGMGEKCNLGDHAISGLAAGLFWPLYWSWELQEKR
jgi:hypothetical protein